MPTYYGVFSSNTYRDRGPWDFSTNYIVNDLVVFRNEPYVCIQAHNASPGLGLGLNPYLWISLLAGSRGIINVNSTYGISPDAIVGVSTGARTAIQAALDSAAVLASSVAPVTVTLNAGTYTLELATMPGQASPNAKDASLWLDTNVTFDLSQGVTLRLADNQQLAAGSNQGYFVSSKDPFVVGSTKENIRIVGGTLDSNGNNQTLNAGVPRLTSGLFLSRARRSSVERTISRNLRGTLSGPPGETFHFDVNRCAETTLLFCEADGSGATDTATGFSSNNSTDVTWVNCKSHDLSKGTGFTNWQSGNLSYIACRAWKVSRGAFGSAFNTERSVDVIYTQCVAGGNSNHLPIASQSDPNPWYTTDGESLYCHNGFTIQGSSNVIAVGCSARDCENVGVNIVSNTAISPPTFTADATNTNVVLANVTSIVGVIELGYTVFGTGLASTGGTLFSTIVGYKDGSGNMFGTSVGGDANNTIRLSVAPTATNTSVAFTTEWACRSVQFIGGDVRGSATSVNIDAHQTDVYLYVKESASLADTFTEYGTATVVRNRMGSAGYRRTGESGAPIQRWLSSGGVTVLSLDSSNRIVQGGGWSRKRTATAISYTALISDHIVAVTDTSALRTITLPGAATAGAGFTLTIKDESGNALVNNITIQRGGADTIEGGVTLKLLAVNFGSLTLYSDGVSKWFVA